MKEERSATQIENLSEFLRQTLRPLLQGYGTLKESFHLPPDAITALISYAIQLANQDRVQDAFTILCALEIIDPDVPEVHTSLGILWMRKNVPHLAKAEFAYALKLNSKDITSLAYLGELHFTEGNLTHAVNHLKAATELDPDARNPFANRARALLALLAEISKEMKIHGPQALQKIKDRIQSA